jgi:hypothetical protein
MPGVDIMELRIDEAQTGVDRLGVGQQGADL